MKLHELKQKRVTIAKEMRALHEKIGENSWTEEQRSQWDNAKHELDKIDAQISREEELRAADAKFVQESEVEHRKDQNKQDVPESRANVFDKFLRHGLGELSAEERSAIKEMRAQAAGIDEKGGYTVPEQMRNIIIDKMKAYGGIASVSQILTTATGQAISWATSDGTAEEGELIGENIAATESDTEFGTDSLGAKKLSSKIIRVSGELLSDSGVNIETYLANRIAQRIFRTEARLIVQGTGAGTPQQPKGLETSVTKGVKTKAATLAYEDIIELEHSLDPAYRTGASFRLAFHDNTLKAIKLLKDGQGRPLWLPDIVGGAPATILNYQYVIDNAIAEIAASKKFMYAGDFDRFILRRVQYMTLKRLVERYAEFDQVGFLAFHRFDCILEDNDAIKALSGKA